MQKLINEVNILSAIELERANKKFPLFHNGHEAYAVIKEEVEEVKTEFDKVEILLNTSWEEIKNNNVNINNIELFKRVAVNMAAESIQVSAMCQKFIVSELSHE